MLAEQITAERALELGLLTKVVDDADLPAATREFASQLAIGPTAAYAAIKQCLAYSASHGLAESLEKEAELQTMLGDTDDHRSATEAFLAKRQPRFGGR
jgi:2-(1,2-epoxy-1,2-dihydrophenyl)acetyl-CoA isomerase